MCPFLFMSFHSGYLLITRNLPSGATGYTAVNESLSWTRRLMDPGRVSKLTWGNI